MINCINCKHCFELYNQCEYANEKVRQCEYYEKIKREVYKNDEDNFYNNISALDRTCIKL